MKQGKNLANNLAKDMLGKWATSKREKFLMWLNKQLERKEF
ncbi:hypothetical protein DB44_EQ00040 [Candidatus Protochlamydia amoebophila]|uniref:Uncharacterized protein n=1 Tax=Candidatus Protochlamydia amoebophila TaxID=362787 RepID=A0A0C1H8E8_9BACT|nr:hypothetical protein DB44_EQ00040 [Candidatus Protochlamydia amoebophila]